MQKKTTVLIGNQLKQESESDISSSSSKSSNSSESESISESESSSESDSDTEKKKKKKKKKKKVIKNVVLGIIRCFSLYRPFISCLYNICIAVVFYFGIKIHLNAGEIMAFYLYLSRFFNPIQNLSDQLNNLQKALSSSRSLP